MFNHFLGWVPLGIPRDILGEIPRDPSGSLGGRWGATLPIFLILKIVILQVVVHPLQGSLGRSLGILRHGNGSALPTAQGPIHQKPA